MVEVAQNNVDTLVLLAEQVLGRDLDVIKGDERRTGGSRVTSLDEFGLDALAALNEQDAQTFIRLHGRDEVVTEDTVGDPLLGTVDNIMFAIGSLLGRGAQPSDITTGESLRDGQANLLLTAKALVCDLLFKRLVVGEVQHCGQSDDHAGHETVLESSSTGAGHLLTHDQVVEVIEFLRLDYTTEERGAVLQVLAGSQTHVQNASLGHALNQLLANQGAVYLLLPCFGRDHLVGEHADSFL